MELVVTWWYWVSIGWEEMENLRGNLGKFEDIWEEIIQKEVEGVE